MATLKEYFDTDFNYALSVHQNQKLNSQDGQKEVEIIARVHLDFNSNTKFISYYIPQTDRIYNVCKSLINNPTWALKISEGQQILGGFVGENQTNSSELIFSGRMFVYSEIVLSEAQIAILKQEAKQLGIAFQFRGPSYAAERSAAEKPFRCISDGSCNGNDPKKSFAIKPSNESQSYINAIGKLLNKTLPQGWEKARIYVEKNNNIVEWKGYYYLKDAAEAPFTINEDLFTNLEKLRSDHKYICPVSAIIFHSNGTYKMSYDHPISKRLALNEIQEIIKKLKSIDLKNVDVDSLKKQISLITVGYKNNTPIIPASQKLYRGVLWMDKPLNKLDLTYPPISKVDKLHRAGRTACPLFYCSTAREAVFYELDCSSGDMLVLSEWKTIDSVLVNNVGYHPQTFQNFSSNRKCPSWGPAIGSDKPEEIDMIINQFLSEEFTKVVHPNEEYLYKISIAIAEQHFQQDMFDGLIYPTVAMKGNADNFAFKPQSVDKKLVLEKVEYIEVKEGNRISGYKISMLDFANSFTEDDKIEWKGRLPHWALHKKGEMLHVSVENGRWISRNEKGEIVDME